MPQNFDASKFQVSTWITIDDPVTMAKSTNDSSAAGLNLLRSHAKAYRLYQSKYKPVAKGTIMSISKNNKIVKIKQNPALEICEKTGLRGFRPGLTQTGLYSHRRWLEA